LKNRYDIHIVNAPRLHSSSNGQVERIHSTPTEIARCIKIDKKKLMTPSSSSWEPR